MDQQELSERVGETLKTLASRVAGAGGLQSSRAPRCLRCNDTQIVQVVPAADLPLGTAPVVRFCECREESRRQKLIARIVPDMWVGLKVADLRPYPGIAEIFAISSQENLLRIIKADPMRGYAFFGPSGCGKSRFLHCLIQEAINQGKEVFYSKMGRLIQVMRENEFGRLPEERWGEIIEADDLRSRKDGDRLHIFIDEIDKIPITDDAYLKILELVDFIYENRNRATLNVCSNLDTDKFAKIWGDALSRRIEDICKVIEIKAPKK